ncbi:MAG: winged helix-turn-helix domain-containing protein [Candidatus Eremiobacteraeota bacterium]|nr:winged helix-turn-helix domain-containing protein [Candidatus Eremiobacteraeota bacterium]
MRFGPFYFNVETQQLKRGENDVPLDERSAALLKLLVQNRDRSVSKDEILDCVGKASGFPDDRVFHRIWVLRRLLGEYASDGNYIVTVPKQGYRFIA